jgi:hypothetical protein
MLRHLHSLRSALPGLLLSAVVTLGALGSSAAPARADDAARIIGGIIALYAIGRAIENADRHRPSRNYHVPSRPRHLVAPARCFIAGRDRNGHFRGYVRRCMQHHARHARLLPSDCLRRVDTRHGARLIYGGRCLARNGWVREAGARH